jgi:hypothetical protein
MFVGFEACTLVAIASQMALHKSASKEAVFCYNALNEQENKKPSIVSDRLFDCTRINYALFGR